MTLFFIVYSVCKFSFFSFLLRGTGLFDFHSSLSNTWAVFTLFAFGVVGWSLAFFSSILGRRSLYHFMPSSGVTVFGREDWAGEGDST
jgi:hypothetical protein